VIDACPPDQELERLLARAMDAAEGQALQVHVAGCAACRQRLADLNQAGLTLPAWAVTPEYGHEITRRQAGAFEQAAPFSTPSSAGATDPISEPRDASPSPPLDLEESANAPQPTANLRGHRAGERPPARARPDPPSAPPASFGRYEVRRPLGTGGFGTVYLGHDSQLDRPVAIKVLKAGPGFQQADSARFLQEARRLAQLRHPGIVTIHDVGVQDGRVFLVSDYLDGPDIGQWLRNNRPAWPEAARITAAVADALAHVHAQLVVHRDVKPANIILTAESAPVLVDFGLALDETQAGGNEKGIVSGTPWYMSPEQAAGTAHRIDGRTDIYSLGVVLYELLSGRVPFRGTDPLEILRQVREDEPQPPRQLIRDIPPELERVCLKAMAKQLQGRYTTAADFADELRRVLQSTADISLSRQMSIENPASESRAATPATPRSATLTPPSTRGRIREAERRQVTVLVCGCDLFESEAYLALDTEDQAQILRAFHEACERAVRRFEGTIVQCNEQGLLACFGFPVAYEDSARRAARTALALVDDLKAWGGQLQRGGNLEPNPWVGLHTGPAIVEAKEDGISLVGEARNVAVRLKELAGAGQVICTEATQRLFRGRFQCASLGHRQVKGVTQPIQLFQVEKIAVTGSLVESSAPGGLSPLTGRDHEMSLLKDRWERAQEGMGQVVLLIGEAGLGKSRLVHTLKEHVLGQTVEGAVDAPVIEWRCSPHYQNTGLYPVIDFYERALAFGREDPPQDRFERLLRRLEQYDLARPETVPLWSALLSLPTPDRFPPLALPPARQREETFRAMLEWLHVRAARRPILFVVEDLHWVDASTLEFLEHYLAEGLHDRILTVLTFRPEFQTPWPALAHQTSLALTHLTRRQVGDLMRKRAGDTLPEALVEQVYDRTGGVPLFVEEFTRIVQESGAPDSGEQAGTLTKALPAHEIPATLQDLVMARLDRMEGGRDLAQLAAVLGREFSYELLGAVATMGESALQAELGTLVQAELLYQRGRPPRATYIFKHALLEDALYNSLVKAKRQQFHRRIGEVLEARFPQTAESRPELLAHHFSEAGLTEKAVDYWLKAGQRSRERSALSEAIGHLTKGLGLLETLSQTPERDARELQFLTTLAPAYIAAHGYAAPEVGPILHRASELCQRRDDPRQLFGILLGIWEWRIVRADLRLCVELAADGMALAERLNDPGMRMEALFMPGVTMFYRGQFAAARSYHESALAAYDDRERTKFWSAYSGHNAGVTHRCYLALCLWHLGYPDQALKLDRETCELARTIGHAFSLGHAVDFAAFLRHYCRLGADVESAAQEEMAIGCEHGFQLWHALGKLHQAAAMLLQGQCEEVLTLLRKGFDAFRATGAEVRVPAYLALLADAYLQSARFDDAHKALDEGLLFAEKNDDRSHEAELYRLSGELLLAESSNGVAAESYFHKAIETARRQQSRAWELRSTMSLARHWQRQGRRDEAYSLLAAVYGTYTEGFTTPDLVDAAALLKALERP
jgi:serine/threonine protein kinase/tetratricopeptide (TPR) repeat protein